MAAHRIRTARPDELAAVADIERAADERFRSAGIAELADAPATEPSVYATSQADGRLLVAVDADDVPVGFVRLELVDALAHVEQLSVHPEHAGRRLGALLLDAAEGWARGQGIPTLTLLTFAHVPFNRPYYERLGWLVMPEDDLGPGLRALRRHEADLGLDRWPRVAMTKSSAG